MNHTPMSFRLGPRERGVLEDLSDRFGESRADVVRRALRALDASVTQPQTERDERAGDSDSGTY